MLSGGIQHFTEFPTRSAVLVPAGLMLSFVAYIVRNAPQRGKAIVGPIGLGVLTTAVLAFTALNDLATHSIPAEHGHGEAATTTGGHVEQPAITNHHTDDAKPAGTPPATVTPAAERPSATPTTAGDSHDDHPHGTEENHG